jgi:hypothetical protein
MQCFAYVVNSLFLLRRLQTTRFRQPPFQREANYSKASPLLQDTFFRLHELQLGMSSDNISATGIPPI